MLLPRQRVSGTKNNRRFDARIIPPRMARTDQTRSVIAANLAGCCLVEY